MNLIKMKDKIIAFDLIGVIRDPENDQPVPYAFSKLYQAVKQYRKVWIYNPELSWNTDSIKKWIELHDLRWREYCQKILKDPKEETNLYRLAELILEMPPLVESLQFPSDTEYYSSVVDTYVWSWSKKFIIIEQRLDRESFLKEGIK